MLLLKSESAFLFIRKLMTLREYIRLLQLVNTAFLIGGFICAMYGGSIVPQTVANTAKGYVGDTNQFNEDLKNAQLGSYGFKLVVIGLSICGGNIVSLVSTCCYIRYEDNHTVYPDPRPLVLEMARDTAPIQILVERRVTISPTIVEIPNGVDKEKNTKCAVVPEYII
jgi:hypothetical protein